MLYARFQTEESTFFCTILCVPPRTVRFEHESSTELVNGSRATQGEAPMPQPTDAGEKVAGPIFGGSTGTKSAYSISVVHRRDWHRWYRSAHSR